VIDLLIGTAIVYWLVVRKTMGKGNGINKGHDMEKEATVG
jgi:hypothetical protein